MANAQPTTNLPSPTKPGSAGLWITYAAAILAVAGLPLFASDYVLLLAGQTAIFAIAVIGLNVLTGMTGLISLGHAAFFAIGAYVTAVGAKSAGLTIFATLPLSVVVAAFVGILVGMPSLRVRGFYLAVATLSANLLVIFLLERDWLAPFTGGINGIETPSLNLFGQSFAGPMARYYLVAPFAIISLLLMHNLTLTRIGRAFIAIRDHDTSAEILGISLMRYKLMSFAVCAAFGGLAGCLWAYYFAALQPHNFGLLLSIQFLAALIIGGQGATFGPILGAAFVVLLPEFLKTVFGFASGEDVAALRYLGPTREVVFGSLIILFLIFEPRGLAAICRRIWLSTRRLGKSPQTE